MLYAVWTPFKLKRSNDQSEEVVGGSIVRPECPPSGDPGSRRAAMTYEEFTPPIAFEPRIALLQGHPALLIVMCQTQQKGSVEIFADRHSSPISASSPC
jgi:hypothetical protein